jgi:RNA polymerase sigma-70 factor (ECF subfamily)
MHPARSAAAFLSTHWSHVLALRDAGADTEARALADLCKAYWFPLYAFARHRGYSPHDAEDVVQSFFAETGHACFFKKADAEKGRLRTFILTAFTRHLGSFRTHAGAQKRGGGAQLLSIDHDQVEDWLLVDKNSGDETLNFERHWAKNILRAAIAHLEANAGSDTPARAQFQVLSRFLHPDTAIDLTIREAAEETGMSVAACEKAVQRLRQSFRLAVREQVAATLENPTDKTILEEMQQLQRALA